MLESPSRIVPHDGNQIFMRSDIENRERRHRFKYPITPQMNFSYKLLIADCMTINLK